MGGGAALKYGRVGNLYDPRNVESGGQWCWDFGGFMSEVVVQISAEETRDPSRLTHALDAFAKWAAEAGLSADSGDAPDIMMMTEYTGGEMRRKLVFQHRDHAARFLVFWRTERQRFRMPDATPATI